MPHTYKTFEDYVRETVNLLWWMHYDHVDADTVLDRARELFKDAQKVRD